MSINVNDKNIGHATAYAYYKAGGGTMTEAEFTEFMADFGTASQTAVEAAQAALASKNAAQTAATTATTKASEATTAATTATNKAAEASTSASTATSAKDTAVSAASTATSKATEATTAAATAVSAKDDAVSANTAAQSAKTAAQTAQTGAETAAASVSASAAQIATNTSDITELKEDLTLVPSSMVGAISERTRNLFDPTYLITIGGLSYSDGVYTGTAKQMHNAFKAGTNYYPLPLVTFKENTSYRISFEAKTDGNESTDGSGVIIGVYYTDGSAFADIAKARNDQTSEFVFCTSYTNANKTVSHIGITYGSKANNIWHIKNICVTESSNIVNYTPYITAIDLNARALVKTGVGDYFNKQTTVADFSNFTLDTTYQGTWCEVRIPKGQSAKVVIASSSDSDTNSLYFNLYGDESARLNSAAVGTGVGSRTITITNTYGVDITRLNPVLVKVNQQNTYDLTLYVGDYMPDTVEALRDDVDALMDGTASIPSYFNTQLSNAIASVRDHIGNTARNGETFVFISDIHWENNAKNSPALIKKIVDTLPIANVIYGGDTFNGGTQANMRALLADASAKFRKTSNRFFAVFGNHDSNSLDGGTTFAQNEFYAFMQKPSDYLVTYGALNYYYFDNPTTKTRFVVLDSRGGEPGTASDQIAWLNEITSNLTGWHILIFVHSAYHPDTGGSYSDPSTWIPYTFFADIMDAADAINSGNSKVEAIFAAHCHYDWNTETAGGIPVVLIDCDTRQTQTGNGQDLGTTGEQAFDVVTVNYSAKTIQCVRVGRGADRTITY